MATTKASAKTDIEKLVRFFEQNLHQLKVPSFNETQARQQLIDPFFEALGWDVRNRLMKPLYLQEVIPEGRVKTSIGQEVKEQEVLFDAKSALGKRHKEYASILDYIAEDNYKASSKEAVKKPDYRFRIKGQTKFFVEAKKPFVDLSKNAISIFQVKRYGFSGRVPISILTDFEEFRTFDCTHKPQFNKPKLGIIADLDFTYKRYLDDFDLLYDTFSRDAVEAGSLDSLTKKLLQKKTGDFALDKYFLEDLSKWREELARDIARHPKNRRRLNDYTLNESVQRILDRIVFFRVCEDREIEVENTLLAILRLWHDRPGVSLYALLNDLFKQRRALYNGLLFDTHECEELEVGNDVLIKILEGLNYPFSPYYFNEIGVEILGSIYEKFLGKTIRLTPKTVRVEEKPEVRKAGGVYYTPQYIVNYIVDNTIAKLIEGKTPKQVEKLKIIDIACGSGSFLLGAFQKLIDYHIEWYNDHPKDIQTINNVPDAHKDATGNLHLSPRKKRDILVNNIYGVDIDRQAVEVTQMSLYLKVLEGENAETLNPQMTLALKEVYLPTLKKNIKCGNSLIGTDFGQQGELFDPDLAHKVNPFDWEIEFKDILTNSGFDCVIGNPPYGADLSEDERLYLETKFKLGSTDTAALMMKQAHSLLRKNGKLGFIVPKPFTYASNWAKTRDHLIGDIEIIVDVSKVWKEVKLEQIVFIASKGSKQDVYQTLFREEEEIKHIAAVRKKHYEIFGFIVNGLLSSEIEVGAKIESSKGKLGDITTNQRGGALQAKLTQRGTIKVLGGKQLSRYSIAAKPKGCLGKGETSDEKATIKNNSLLVQNIVAHIQNPTDHIKIIGAIVPEAERKNYLILDTINQITCKEPYSNRFVLGILCSDLMNWFVYRFIFAKAIRTMHFDAVVTDRLPVPALNLDKQSDKSKHDQIVELVDSLINLHNQIKIKNFATEIEPIQRHIFAVENKLNTLIFKLYDLSTEEIQIIRSIPSKTEEV